MIYFMQAVGGGPVKIGFTDDVPTRHHALETHYGRELKILEIREGDRSIEKTIHAKFRHLQYPNRRNRGRRTEQFKPCKELLDFIGMVHLASPNPDSVEQMIPINIHRCPRNIKLINKVQPNAITIRGSEEWKDWLDRLALKLRAKPTGVIDRALAELAERVGFEEPPPRMSS